MPLPDFLIGARTTALQPGELVTAIHIPRSAAQGHASFLKLGARKYLIISIAMVAARIETDGDTIVKAAISVGACSPVATRLSALEDHLKGKPVATAHQAVTRDHVAPHLAPIDDIRADAAYRIDAATELTRRAIAALAETQRRAA